MGPEPALSTIDRGCELSLYHHQRICCCCCTLLYCCTTSWVGRLVRGWVVDSVGGWVGSVGGSVRRWSSVFVALGYDVSYFFFLDPLCMVSPLSLDLYYYCCIRHLLYCCCNTWVGGSLRGRHGCTTFCCTAVSRWVDRFVAVTMLCVPPVVSPPLRELFSLFSFFPAIVR